MNDLQQLKKFDDACRQIKTKIRSAVGEIKFDIEKKRCGFKLHLLPQDFMGRKIEECTFTAKDRGALSQKVIELLKPNAKIRKTLRN